MMSSIKNISVIINNNSTIFSIGVISLLLKKINNQKINLFLINTNPYKDYIPSLMSLYKRHLNIVEIICIDVIIINNKLKKIDYASLNNIKKYKFDILVAREQQRLMPKADRLIASLFKYNKLLLLEDNIFGYFLDIKNNVFLDKYYAILAFSKNLFFILRKLFFIKNNFNVLKIFLPKIYTIRKKSKFRISIFKNYKPIIEKEHISLNKDRYPHEDLNIKAIILLDLYIFKTNYYFTKTPSINEIQKGINLYLEFIKKICSKFKLNEKDIRFKIHPMTGEYLLKSIENSDLGKYMLKKEPNDLPLELTFYNFKNLKTCFAIASSSLIFLDDLYQIEQYFIKTREYISEPNYKIINKLIKTNQVNYVNF